MRWGALTIYLGRVGGETWLDGWIVEGPVPSGAKLPAPTSIGAAWSGLASAGAQWDELYGIWEMNESRGELAPAGPPSDSSTVVSVSAGFAYLLGC